MASLPARRPTPEEEVAELAAAVHAGEVDLTGTPVLAWVTTDQTAPVMVDLAYVETIADQCGGCYAYVTDAVLDATGSVRYCGWRYPFCPACWVDEPHWCGHPEHH